MNRLNRRGRLLIIGLDGATLDLIRPWADKGLLPNLSRLLQEGVAGNLRSTIPTISPAAWTSMITGKNPGKHGVYDFIRRRRDSYHLQYTRPDLQGLETIFNYLSRAGRRVGVMGVPSTYPPEPVNGFMIAGPWAPSKENAVYPSDMFAYLKNRGYEINNTVSYTPETADTFVDYLEKVTDIRATVALELLRKEPWDLFTVVFRDTDTVAHKYWQDMDPTHPAHNPERAAKLGNAILNHYRQLDGYIGDMLDIIGKDRSVMIVSDHGAGPLLGEISVNKWLLDIGLLSLKMRSDLRDRYLQILRKIGVTRSGVIRWLGWPLANWLRGLIPGWTETMLPWPHAQLIEQVDWSKTRAYSFGSIGQIHINLRNREPEGIVEPGADYEAVVDYIIDQLDGLRDRNGKKIQVDVFRREDLYHGPFADEGPDLNLIFDDMEYITHITLDAVRDQLIGPPGDDESGTHRLNGTFILWGPGIRKGRLLGPAQIVDVAPTAMYLLGEPVPKTMDGRVLIDAFEHEFLAEHPPSDGESIPGESPESDLPAWSPEEEEQIREHLRSLGYLG